MIRMSITSFLPHYTSNSGNYKANGKTKVENPFGLWYTKAE